MKTFTLPVLCLAIAVLTGCPAKKIPGTEIDDTDDTHAVLDVMEKYRKALEKKDVATLVSLFDPTFHDDAGTTTPDDDLDYAELKTVLPRRLAEMDEIRLDMLVRKVEFNDETKTATATYTFTTSFTLPRFTNKRQQENDIKQMVLKRSGKDDWKIVSGS